MMMNLNSTSSSLDNCPQSIDFDESDPNISLNYLEDYLSSLVNQLESELSYLPSSTSQSTTTESSKNTDNNQDDDDDDDTTANTSPPTIDTSAATINNYSPTSVSTSPSLTRFNHQRESPLSFVTSSNYSRSSLYENNDEISYNLLTASQIQRIIDYYKPLMRIDDNPEGKWDKKVKKIAGNSYLSHHLFGSDINGIEKSNGGLTLPPFIENALIYLARYGINSVGIFRKSGVKSRIMALRQKLENMTGFQKEAKRNGDATNGQQELVISSPTPPPSTQPQPPASPSSLRLNYSPGDDFCVYDVADMVKMWLREIKPRPLVTKEVIAAFKEMMTNDQSSLPSASDLGLKLTVLLSDSQRAILEIFLHFLSLFAGNSEMNQMNSQNLAICFTPSLCECDNITGLGFGCNGSIETNNGQGSPKQADTEIIFDAQRCLRYLIDNCSAISMVSVNSLPFPIVGKALSPSSPATNGHHHHHSNNQKNHDHHHSDHHNHHGSITNENGNNGCYSSSSSLINGGNLLPPTYESSIIINAAPCDILKRILYQRNLFDPTLVEWRIVKESSDENSDLFEFKVQSSLFLPVKSFTIERKWTFIDSQPVVVEPQSRSFCSSLKKSKIKTFKGIILRETGYLYDSWWRIGTHGEGKCQLEISIAVDLRGHSYYWYTNTFPAIIDWQLYQIKQSFLVDFIETKNFKSTTV